MNLSPSLIAALWVKASVACGAFLAIAAAVVIVGTAAAASAATADANHTIAAPAASPSPSTSASPHPTASTAPAAPQPAGSPFPWDTLIVALSSLAAGLGAVLLKDQLDTRHSRNDKLLDRYAGLTASLDQLIRLIRHPDTVNLSELPPTLGAAVGLSVGSVQRAYAPVYLTAPAPTQTLAEQAWKAAWDIQLWLDRKDRFPAEELVPLVEALETASGNFTRAVRAEAKAK